MSTVSKEDAGALAVPLLAVSAVPQSPQNRFPGEFSAPQFAQRFVNGDPQSPQNFFPVGLSLPHFEQRIGSSGVRVKEYRPSKPISLVSRCDR
jgi:hypothetical protein